MAEVWSDDENDRLVHYYLRALVNDLKGLHRLRGGAFIAPMTGAGRSDAAVRMKASNISAILADMGLPMLDGFKPLPNIQHSLVAAVNRGLKAIPLVTEALEAAEREVEVGFTQDLQYVRAPKGSASATTKRKRVGSKINYSEREEGNRSLGLAGEKAVAKYLRSELINAGRQDLATRVEHVSVTVGDGIGYDILSFETDGTEVFVEVKTTRRGIHQPFVISAAEVCASQELGDQYRLYRVFDWGGGPSAGLYILAGDLTELCTLTPVTYLASPA